MARPMSMTLFRRVLFFAVFLTFDLIMFGAFVRVTDAGLGCPDWPGCYGKISPIGAIEEIRSETVLRPDGPVTVFKAWVEMLHRYIAAGLGVLVIALAIMASRLPGPSAPLAWFTLVWIILQGAFGAFTVTLKLMPLVVTLHLLGGMILFGLLLAQWVRVRPATQALSAVSGVSALRPLVTIALAVLLCQIALGGWVSTNYATLACRDFPLCQGSLWPDMDFEAGFELWRRLGYRGDDQALPFQALTAIHFVHRLFAGVVLVVVGALALRLRRSALSRSNGNMILAVLALQVVTGLTNIFLDWPLVAAVLHTGGAAALLGLLLMVALPAWSAPAKA
jgi:cytochrome c oxidase assembly protein subunit 15